MRTLTRSVAVLTVSLSAQLAFAQTEDFKPLSMKYDDVAFDVVPDPVKSACVVRLMPTVDARRNKETLGTNFARPLLSGDASPWVTTGLQNLKAYGFTVDTANDTNRQGAIILTPKVIRAYTWQVGLKLFGTVVVKMDYQMPNGSVETKTYRSSGDKTNMWGADEEYMTTLNYAFNNMLKKVAEDLEKRCAGTAA